MRGFTDMEQVLFTRVADCRTMGRVRVGWCILAWTISRMTMALSEQRRRRVVAMFWTRVVQVVLCTGVVWGLGATVKMLWHDWKEW